MNAKVWPRAFPRDHRGVESGGQEKRGWTRRGSESSWESSHALEKTAPKMMKSSWLDPKMDFGLYNNLKVLSQGVQPEIHPTTACGADGSTERISQALSGVRGVLALPPLTTEWLRVYSPVGRPDFQHMTSKRRPLNKCHYGYVSL